MAYLQEAEGKIKQNMNGNYDFKFSKYFKEGWDLTKKTLPYFLILLVGFLALFFILALFMGGFAFVGLAGIEAWTSTHFGLIAIFGFILGIILTPLNVGGYLIIYASDIRKDEGVSNYVKGYDDFAQIAIYSLLVMVPGFAVRALVYWVGLPYWIYLLTGLVVIVLTLFSLMLITIKKYSFLAAIKTSIALTGPKFLHILLLFFFIIILNMIGAMVIGLGLFITIPYSLCIIYAYFKDVCLTEESFLDIEDNLINE